MLSAQITAGHDPGPSEKLVLYSRYPIFLLYSCMGLVLRCLTSGLAAASTTRLVLRAGLGVDTQTLAGRRAAHEAVMAAIAAG